MIRFNLLPYREERRKVRRQQFFVFSAIAAAAAAAIWFFGSAVIGEQVDRQNEKNSFLKKEISALDKQIKEIEKLQEQTEELSRRKQLIESLQANRSETVYMFTELTTRLPTGVYLNTLKQQGNKIILTGYAQSNARVSTLMRSLDESPYFENPGLLEIVSANVAGKSLSRFGLTVFFTRQTVKKPKAS